MSDSMRHVLTSSAVDSRAKISAVQARELASLVLAAAFGTNSREWSTSFHLNGLSSKTSPAERSDGSTTCVISWQASVMRRYRSRLRRLMLAHPMNASASSLLPTPTASDYGTSNNGDPKDGRTEGMLMPTPTRSDATGGVGLGKRRQGGPNLRTMLATPTATGNQLSPDMQKWEACRAFKAMHPPGPLHPCFVEWMMGFPIDWTELQPWGMQLSLFAPKSSDTL